MRENFKYMTKTEMSFWNLQGAMPFQKIKTYRTLQNKILPDGHTCPRPLQFSMTMNILFIFSLYYLFFL